MRKLVTLALAAAAFQGAVAQEDMPAILIATAKSGAKWFVRTDRVTRTPMATNVWVYVYPAKPEPIYKNKPLPTYSSQVAQWSISCAGGTYTIGRASFYSARGDFLDANEPVFAPQTPNPDTIADAVVQRVCSPDFPGR